MKDRITARLRGLEVGQRAAFIERVHTSIPTVDETGAHINMIDRATVNDVLLGECMSNFSNVSPDRVRWEVAEEDTMYRLARDVVSAERVLQDEYLPQRVHFATQKIERRFSTSMGQDARGVHSTLSITVYRVT